METQSVTNDSNDPIDHAASEEAARRLEHGDPYENAVDVLEGLHAVGSMLWDITNGEQKGTWSGKIIDGLFTAQRIMIQAGMRNMDALHAEHWRSMALHGAYGEKARQRAMKEDAEKGRV